jgi:hypothetical protein
VAEYIHQQEEYARRVTDTTCAWSSCGGYAHPQPGSGLIQYGMRQYVDKSLNPTIIAANYLDDDEQPMQLSDSVLTYCKRAGIHNIIVGHLPMGDAPTLITTEGIRVICGDTSYSNDVEWTSVDKSLYSYDEEISR